MATMTGGLKTGMVIVTVMVTATEIGTGIVIVTGGGTVYRDRDDRRFDDRRFYGDRYRRFDRDDYRFERERFFVGDRRFINGYYWTWDGGRWYRRDNRGINLYFNF
jgi:hypothetical protein